MSAKSDVIRFLEQNKGSFLSGNDMAQQLGISRAAVNKAVKSLIDEGYEISAVNNKGYCLSASSDILSAESIKLNMKNTFFGDIKVYKEVSSTNAVAKELASNGAAEGTTVFSMCQTAGKGRLGRSFISPMGSGIYMSVILKPQIKAEEAMIITSAAAVAVSRAVSKVCGLETAIKWVNDVYANGKKLCGILTEATINFETRLPDYVVVGIGINITPAAFPDEIKGIATSIKENIDTEFTQSKLAAALLDELYNIYKDLDKKTFLDEYKKRSFIIGHDINVIAPSGSYTATALDINELGNLIVKDKNGDIHTLNSGEISVRKI